jgi:hypothetical protein
MPISTVGREYLENAEQRVTIVSNMVEEIERQDSEFTF